MGTSGRHISRREALKISGAAAAALTAATPLALSRTARAMQAASSASIPRNVIFMVADGMSPGVPALAEGFSQIVRGKGTNWRDLAAREDVVRGYFDMASLNSLVTDSAAASSSWGSGSRICNWALNTLPDGRVLTPLAPLAKQRGKRVGLVTTTRVSHATPAGFAAAAPLRDLEDDIAPQFIDRVDVLLGGGRMYFDPTLRKDKRDLLGEYQAKGWAFIDSRDALLRQPASSDRLLGLFWNDHLPYTIDRDREPAMQQRVPTLAELTRTALSNLATSNDGFLLQVEGGRVDHAAHDNDAASMLRDQLAFDDAVGAAVEFARARGDTLVIITTDHGTGNPGLSGMGGKYQKSNAGLARLAGSTASFDAINARLAALRKKSASDLEAPDIAHVVLEGTGIEISPPSARTLANAFAGKKSESPADVCMFQSSLAGLLGQALSNISGVTFTGIVHTSDWALSLALGPGSQRFGGMHLNTDAFEIIAEFFGIEHRNPRMTPEEAMRFSHASSRSVSEHAV